MARIKLTMPEKYAFTTEMTLRIGDINYGGHMDNAAVLALAHEARIRFLAEYGWTELDVEGHGVIMSDAAVVYRSEGFHGDKVKIFIAVSEISSMGFDLMYLLTNSKTGLEIARVKTGMVFFDYQKRRPVKVPEKFSSTFAG